MDTNIQNKYKWIMILHALGDTIGFKNGDWEFNYFNTDIQVIDFVNELIYEFIHLGGVNGINLSEWKISDDTFFHIAIAESLLHYDGTISNNFINVVKNNMQNALIDIIEDEKKHSIKRYVGFTTAQSIRNFSESHDARDAEYNDEGGGNGCAMRSLVIGMCLFGEKNRRKLIDCSIITSQLTHNNPIGYLGGFTAALFTALALENIPLDKWPFILIDELVSDKLKSFVDSKNLDQAWDYNLYLKNWKKYIATRFIDGIPIKNKAFTNPLYRIRYYYDNFFKDTNSTQIGGSGFLCMIIAYDALLVCDGKWEKLIVYGMLHNGDSDTIGAIAGGLYGAVYGKGDVPDTMLKYIEKKDKLDNLAKKLFDRFN